MALQFSNSYAALPETFYTKQPPALKAENPSVFFVNERLATELGADPGFVTSKAGTGLFSGRDLPAGADPLAMVYAGHQFGGWSPGLGDGRALLVGEVISPRNERFDIQLKGSGRTPYSRGGDGKSALGPVIREYLVSEAMHKLGVPTTRALAAAQTGETVLREQGPLPGGIFTRVAKSHVRVGTFQYFAAEGDYESLRRLVEYVIDRHYPTAKTAPNPVAALLKGVMNRQADLIALWLKFGFIHGVMNTDNMQIAGETLDYGPCAFMDRFDVNRVFSAIDRNGRYAWGQQPRLAHWNLARFGEALLPVWNPVGSEDPEAAGQEIRDVLGEFGGIFNTRFVAAFSQKLGLQTDVGENSDVIRDFIEDTLGMMARQKADFTLFFSNLTRSADPLYKDRFLAGLEVPEDGEVWLERLAQIRSDQGLNADAAKTLMSGANPVYSARNHRVEAAIQAGLKQDFDPMRRLHAVLQNPFKQQEGCDEFEQAPQPGEEVLQTFCGT